MNKRPYFLFFIFFMIAAPAQADQGLTLIHADKSVGQKISGQLVRKFEGNVHFEQDTLQMFCDRALFYEKENRLEFNGHVYIINGRQRIRAKKIDYYPDTRLAVCMGNVRVATPDDSLSSAYLAYNFKSGKVKAETDVYLLSRPDHVQIWGDKGLYDPENNISRIQTKARLVRMDTTSGDTLQITSEILEYHRTEHPFAVALDSVVILQGALKAVCDTAYYYPDTQQIILRKSPLIWYEDSRLSGIDMTVQLDSLHLKNIFVSGKAQARSLADSLRKLDDILTGKTIRFDITDNKPQKIQAVGNASSIYYLKEDNKNNGVNYATADTILVLFRESKVDSIEISGGAQGIYYPENYKGEKKFGE